MRINCFDAENQSIQVVITYFDAKINIESQMIQMYVRRLECDKGKISKTSL